MMLGYETITFANPWLLSLILLMPVFALYLAWRGRSYEYTGLRYAYNPLTASTYRSWKLRFRWLMPLLRFLAMALLIIAFARPQAGEASEVVERESLDIALALDISGSMSALDFDPQNRLEAAKEVITDFIKRRDDDRIGLVVFSRDAFIHSPLTIDHQALHFLVGEIRLAGDLGIDDGTAMGMGLGSAANLLKDSALESKVIVLLTDGVNTTGEIDPITAAAAAKALGIKVYTIAVGRPGAVGVAEEGLEGDGAPQEGSEVDEATLRQIAELTGGGFFRATDGDELRRVYDEIDKLETSKIRVRSFTRFQELWGWLLFAGGALLITEVLLSLTVFRRIP